jgi:hypothetical protein
MSSGSNVNPSRSESVGGLAQPPHTQVAWQTPKSAHIESELEVVLRRGVNMHGSKDEYLGRCLGGERLHNCPATINRCDLIIAQPDLFLEKGTRLLYRLPSANQSYG